MKILVISDTHSDAVTFGVPRLDDVAEYRRRIIQIASEENVDGVIDLGDVHDPGDMLESQYCELLTTFVARLVARELRFVAMIAGNHDVVEAARADGVPVTTLSPLRPLAMISDATQVFVCEDVGLHRLGEDVALLALPHVARCRDAVALDRAMTAFDCAQSFVDSGGKLIVAAHLTVPGAQLGTESVEMARGRDLVFPVERVAALRPAVVLNGHYHRRQVVRAGGLEIVIPGSAISLGAAEAGDNDKGYLIVEV